jgi:hypothetical protein
VPANYFSILYELREMLVLGLVGWHRLRDAVEMLIVLVAGNCFSSVR